MGPEVMPIDPTTLNGRPWKSLTPEEREACPDGTVLRHPTENFGPLRRAGGLWMDLCGNTHDTAMMTLADPMGYVVHIPDATPTPDQFREMHQLLGGKTDPTPHIPRPGEKLPVYAIGRFVVAPLASGDRLAFAGASVAGVSTATNYIAVSLRDAHGSEVSYVLGEGVTMDTLLHAIAKAEGR